MLYYFRGQKYLDHTAIGCSHTTKASQFGENRKNQSFIELAKKTREKEISIRYFLVLLSLIEFYI